MVAQRSLRYCDTCGTRLARDNRLSQCATCQRKAGELVLGAPVIGPDFWSSSVIAEALHSWHIGQVIRAYRHHPFHGSRPLSQELVASWLGLTQTQLSRIESGPPVKDLGKLVAWARALHVPADLLWFKLPEQPATSLPAASFPRTADAVVRKDEPTEPASALNGARDFNGSVVDHLTEQLRRSKADDGTFGPGRALPLVLGVVEAVAQHAKDARLDERRQLLMLGADGAEFAGWLYRDLGDTISATYWYDRAMEWAQAANDTAMQGYVLLKKSQMAYDQRDAYRVAMFAEAAQHGPWQLPAAIRAEVTQQEVVGMAMLGEPLSAIERKTDEARRLLAEAAEDEPGSRVNAYFTMETLSLRTAACYTEAGKPARAAKMFDEILGCGTLSRRDFGFFSARRATALALCGEPDEAANVGLTALRVAQETRSERTVRLLGDVVRTLEPWSSRPGPRTLKEAVPV
jgi:transcriptional regulator with XRE-family HTH domain